MTPPDGLEAAAAGHGGALDADAPRAGSAFPSIWAFIAADCVSFGIFFAVFMSERFGHAASFDQSARQLEARLGLLNTLILISSSWLVALATAAARGGDMARVRRLLRGAIGVACGFGVVKLFEYAGKISHGITPLSSEFFGYYFALTGVHFVHYLIGMVVLILLLNKVPQRSGSDAAYQSFIDSGSIYWHMVDLLWVFLFPMLYLLGGR